MIEMPSRANNTSGRAPLTFTVPVLVIVVPTMKHASGCDESQLAGRVGSHIALVAVLMLDGRVTGDVGSKQTVKRPLPKHVDASIGVASTIASSGGASLVPPSSSPPLLA
ncbi:MAG: hypothetical protein QM736_14535 [Vicinamibacterales bacterium]